MAVKNSTKNAPVTAEEAALEVLRRCFPKGSKFRGQYPRAQVMGMSGKELRAVMGDTAQAPAPTKAAPKAKPAKADVEARRQAWAWRLEQIKAGNKVTYADACAHFGTKPARKSA